MALPRGGAAIELAQNSALNWNAVVAFARNDNHTAIDWRDDARLTSTKAEVAAGEHVNQEEGIHVKCCISVNFIKDWLKCRRLFFFNKSTLRRKESHVIVRGDVACYLLSTCILRLKYRISMSARCNIQ
jgi:hypothetical protein